VKTKMLTVILAIAAMFVGCGKSANTVNAFIVYDDRTLSCKQAENMTMDVSDRSRGHESTYRTARSKLNWCEAASGSGLFLLGGNFDSAAKIYEFKKIPVEDGGQVSRFCLDVAVTNAIVDVPPANLAFKVQTTIAGEVETFTCDQFTRWLWESKATVLFAPAHLPLLIDIDPVLVLATGANPQLEGVPHKYYDEVRVVLEGVLSDIGTLANITPALRVAQPTVAPAEQRSGVVADRGPSIQDYLDRLAEPTLWEDCGEEVASYRFLKFDAGQYVASVRVSRESRHGDYRTATSSSPGTTKSLDGFVEERTWDLIKARFDAADFWSLRSKPRASRSEGNRIFVEACEDGRYRAVERESHDRALAPIVTIMTRFGRLEWLEGG
jgi:hypothetical protein